MFTSIPHHFLKKPEFATMWPRGKGFSNPDSNHFESLGNQLRYQSQWCCGWTSNTGVCTHNCSFKNKCLIMSPESQDSWAQINLAALHWKQQQHRAGQDFLHRLPKEVMREQALAGTPARGHEHHNSFMVDVLPAMNEPPLSFLS